MRSVPLRTTVIELKLWQELKYYITQNASFHGPLNYYRTTRIRFDEEKGKRCLAYELARTYSPRGSSW